MKFHLESPVDWTEFRKIEQERDRRIKERDRIKESESNSSVECEHPNVVEIFDMMDVRPYYKCQRCGKYL